MTCRSPFLGIGNQSNLPLEKLRIVDSNYVATLELDQYAQQDL